MAEQKVQRLSWGEGALVDVLTISYEKIGRSLTVDCRTFPAAIYRPCEAARHGVGQRFGDLESGDKAGKAKFTTATELLAHYKAGGTWRMDSERDTTAVIFEALQRIDSKYTKPALEKVLEAKPEAMAEWRAAPQVKAMVAKIRAEKAAKAAKESTEKLNIEV